MQNVLNLVFKKLTKPQGPVQTKFYRSQQHAYVIDRTDKLYRISRRGAVGQAIDWQRIVCGYCLNYWVPIDYVFRCGGRVLNMFDTFELEFKQSFEVGNKTYNGSVELVNIGNIDGIEFDKKLLKTKRYNKTKRIEHIETGLINTQIAILEGVSNLPQVDVDVDGIIVPSFDQFVNCDEYYQTVFHEIAHYVRFKDFEVDPFSIEDYAVYCTEEIIAELTASKLSQAFKLNCDYDNSASYINFYACELACQLDLDLQEIKKIIKRCQQYATITSDHVLQMMKL